MSKQKRNKNTEAARTISLNRRILGANAKYQESVSLLNELQLELASRSSLEEIQKIVVPHKYEITKSSTGQSTAVILASDWHIDEIVAGEEINYLNEFNLEIAEKRAETFFSHTIKLLDLYRNGSKIETVVFAALGDFISGWIHPELIESSLLTPPEALMKAYELLLGGLKFLVDEGGMKELIFIGCCGNHSRITTKPRHKKMVKKTYEWMMYEFLARSLANTKYAKVIKFKLPTGYFNYLDIYNTKVRFHHGDNIRYQGGIGGIFIPLRKALAQWNKAYPVDLDAMAHWHTRETSEGYTLNGSLIGYGTFAESIKADFRKPEQSFFLIHPKYGKTSECKIVLE